MTPLYHVSLCQNMLMPPGKNFSRNTYQLPCCGILHYIRVNRKFVLRKNACFLLLSLELAGIEQKVQAGMFVSQKFKSVCTSEQSDQMSHFLPIDRPSKRDQTAWMGTHVNLYLLLDTGSNYYARKPVFRITDITRLKSVSTTTETS